MWPFRKRIPLKDSGIFEGFTDWHSHILPGVDDGVQTMEEALEILRLYEELGVKSRVVDAAHHGRHPQYYSTPLGAFRGTTSHLHRPDNATSCG